MTKPIWTSKTFWFNLLTAIVTAVEASGLIDVVPPEFQPYLLMAVAFLNIVLRLITYQPVTLK